jgi:type I site-specific restriction-modification system R (restriction) subunit
VGHKLKVTDQDCDAGGEYLVQPSEGSGKTTLIVWSGHFLPDLHGAEQKVFDTVLVVFDRTIDQKLQQAIFDFPRTAGLVAMIRSQEQSKIKISIWFSHSAAQRRSSFARSRPLYLR